MNTEPDTESQSLRHLSQTIQADMTAVRSTALDLDRQILSFVRERPVTAVLVALGLGFAVARLFAGRR